MSFLNPALQLAAQCDTNRSARLSDSSCLETLQQIPHSRHIWFLTTFFWHFSFHTEVSNDPHGSMTHARLFPIVRGSWDLCARSVFCNGRLTASAVCQETPEAPKALHSPGCSATPSITIFRAYHRSGPLPLTIQTKERASGCCMAYETQRQRRGFTAEGRPQRWPSDGKVLLPFNMQRAVQNLSEQMV